MVSEAMFPFSGRCFENFMEFKCLKMFSSSLLSMSSLAPDFRIYSSNSPEVSFKVHKRGFIVNFTVAALTVVVLIISGQM